MKRGCKTQYKTTALLLIGIGLLILFFCVPTWVFCCLAAAILIAAGLLLLKN